MRLAFRFSLPLFVLASLLPFVEAAGQTPLFVHGNLVVVVEGCGTVVTTGCAYTDNQGAPMTLFQYKPTGTASATYVNSLVLPQTGSGANLPVSSEYGSSSEGTLSLSGDGRYLTLAGYGINAATYNANPAAYGTLASKPTALAQSGSLTGQSYTPVARVITLVDANGNVNSATGLFNIYNLNNPRSVYTADGFNAYVSGQGSGADGTGGVFFTPLGAVNNAPVAITGLDTTTFTVAQDTRTVQIYNGALWVSVDSKGGSNNARSFLGTLGTPPATSLYLSPAGTYPAGGGPGPTQFASSSNANTTQLSSTSKLTLTASEANGINKTGQQINLSPSGFFFANASTVYVADTGNPKQNSATSLLGDGGLQKWVNTKADGSGTWQLQWTLAAGLSLVQNPSATPANTAGTTGLYSVVGVINGATVNLYVVNATIGDTDQTYIYGVTDTIASTVAPVTPFTLLATAPADSNFKGIALAPSYPAGSATLTTVPSGLSITTAGTGCAPGSYTTPVTLVWTPGATCTLSTNTPQYSAKTPYVFSQWQDGTTSLSDAVIAPTTSATYTATFTNTFQPVGALEKAVDNTTASTTVQQGDSLLVSGWVADPVDGSPLSNVTVYVDTTTSLGTPTLGIARPDVAAAYNSTYANSGYSLVASTSGLALGPHSVTVVAVDSNNRTTTFGPLTFTLVATPQVTVTSSSIVYGTATTTLSANVAYSGSTAPTGGVSFTVNGSSTGVGTVTCTGAASPLTCTATYTLGLVTGGSYTVVATEAASTGYNSASGQGTLTVNAATPQVTVTSSSIVYGAATTTLTAKVAYSGSAAPTGGLSFTVNGSSTGVGTVTCTGTTSPLTCTASYASSTLANGSYTVVATEGSSSSYNTASGQGSLTVGAAADFSFTTLGTTYQSVVHGSTATYTFSLAPIGPSYPAAVYLNVGFVPPAATYTITPATVGVLGGAQTITLTVQTPSYVAANATTKLAWERTAAAFLLVGVLPLYRRRKGWMRGLLLALVCCGSLLTVAGVTGCSSGTSSLSLPIDYNVTVAATSGGVQHTSMVTLDLK